MEPNSKILKLEQQLKNAIAAEQFFTSEPGRLFSDLVTEKVNQLMKEITSDKFLKDHVGYVNAVTELRVYKDLLRRLQFNADPKRKLVIEEALDDAAE